jgi:hypothetical protein
MPNIHLVTVEEIALIASTIRGRSKVYSATAVYTHVNEPTFPLPYGKRGARWVWPLKQVEHWYRNRKDRRAYRA